MTTTKAIVAAAVIVAILARLISFLTMTITCKAIVFATQDPATFNHVAGLKADYVRQFELTKWSIH